MKPLVLLGVTGTCMRLEMLRNDKNLILFSHNPLISEKHLFFFTCKVGLMIYNLNTWYRMRLDNHLEISVKSSRGVHILSPQILGVSPWYFWR